MSDFQELTGIELLKHNKESIKEITWKQSVQAASEQEKVWICEAIPTAVLEDELRRRTDFMADAIHSYLDLSIKVRREECRRRGIV